MRYTSSIVYIFHGYPFCSLLELRWIIEMQRSYESFRYFFK